LIGYCNEQLYKEYYESSELYITRRSGKRTQ